MSKRRLFSFVLPVTGLLAGAQFVRPELTNPPVTADLQAPPDVKHILKRACYDCHSNETNIPWFDRIAPASWLVASDVREGRKHLNFSALGDQPPARQKGVLFESVNHVLLGSMPPKAYVAVHRDARVTDEDLTTLKNYLNTLTAPGPAPKAAPANAAPPPPDPAREGAPKADAAVQASPNGIELPADYPSWKPISGTERFDNGSLRAVLGNEPLVRAIDEGHAGPWPDGVAFAKVAWSARADADGTVHAGDFVQVEFMLKDSKRYASTEGWGWARWRGRDLKPYGKDATFVDECVGCHAPMRDNDLVFTTPFRRTQRGSPQLNEAAALPDVGAFRPFDGQVISVFTDPKRSAFTMLYGNDVATPHARSGRADPYPAGSILALVSWTEAEDERWFGARVPGQVGRVDVLRFAAAPGGEPAWTHEAYERKGAAAPAAKSPARLDRVPTEDPESRARLAWVVEQRGAEMPRGRH